MFQQYAWKIYEAPSPYAWTLRTIFTLISKKQNRCFQKLFERLNIACRIPTIDHAMITADRNIHQFGTHNIIALEYRAFYNLVGADNRDFWAIDNRRGRNTAQWA